MEEGLLSLKWNNHKSTFFQVLSLLREKHAYTDVTLACEGRFYQAHKFVLSTCSEYFSDIFTSATSGTSIVIVLKDVKRQDLEYLLDYMYLGQVDVAQSELPSLIKTAECLRIKGLAIPDDEPHKTQRRNVDDREGSPPPSKKKKCLQEDGRHNSTSISTTNTNSTITSPSSSSVSGRLQMEVLPPPPDRSSLVQQLRQVPISQQSVQALPPPLPTSLGSSSSSSKNLSSQSQSLNLTTQISRTSQGGTVPSSTTTAQPSHSSLSPSLTTPIPVIKEEAADPPETPESYLNESFEESETKPDVSDSRHLDPDGAIPGPSGLQGSVDSWEGDGEMAAYGGGDGYPEGSLDEQGDSEVQGEVDVPRTPGMHHHHPPPHPLDPHITTQNSLESTTFPLDHQLTHQTSVSARTAPPSLLSNSSIFASPTEVLEISSQDLLSPTHQVGSHMSDGFSRFTCPYCGKISRCLSHLQTHIRIHTGERPYACSFCSFRTTQKVALKEHIYTHTGEKPHECPYCDFKCAKKCNLNSHIKRHHNM